MGRKNSKKVIPSSKTETGGAQTGPLETERSASADSVRTRVKTSSGEEKPRNRKRGKNGSKKMVDASKVGSNVGVVENRQKDEADRSAGLGSSDHSGMPKAKTASTAGKTFPDGDGPPILQRQVSTEPDVHSDRGPFVDEGVSDTEDLVHRRRTPVQSERNEVADVDGPSVKTEVDCPSASVDVGDKHCSTSNENSLLNDGVYVDNNETTKRLSKICIESGFKPTGKVLRKFSGNHFERSGLAREFDLHLSSKKDKGCNLNKEQTEVVLKKLRTRRKPVDFYGGAVTGVPGSGKSTLLRRLQCEGNIHSVVILGNDRQKHNFSNIPACYSAKEILLLQTQLQFDVLLIDEYTLLNNGEILLLQRILGSKIVVIFGDRAQGSTNSLGSAEWLQFPVVYQSSISRRFGKETAKLCASQGLEFEGNESIEDKVETTDYEGSSEVTDINLVFSTKTQEDLLECNIGSTLVEEVQGAEFDSVTLFILESDEPYLRNKHLVAVALTRQRTRLIVRCDRAVWQNFVTGLLGSAEAPATHRYGSDK